MTDSPFLQNGIALPCDDEEPEIECAAIYARTSSVSQKFGYSIEEQVRQCTSRCQMLNWNITHLFRDPAVSGKDTERPMFQQMLTQAEAGAFDVLVFWKLDRFSRSIMHAVQLEKKFRDWGIALHSITEQIDTTTPAGRFNFRNIANAAEFERDLIKQRTRMGHTARALEQKWPNGTQPLGYTTGDDDRLYIKPSEAKLVEQIFERYLEYRSMPELADTLNQEGVLTKSGTTWTASSISSILRNRLYVGDYQIGSVEEKAENLRIISTELFNKVEVVRKRFRNSGSDRTPMPRQRKKQNIDSIESMYDEFLQEYK